MHKRSDRFIYSDPEDDGSEDLRSRTDAKRERRATEDALMALSKELVALSEKRLSNLSLPEPVLDAVRDARAIRSAAARNRQLRLVRSALRDVEWQSIEARLRQLAPAHR